LLRFEHLVFFSRTPSLIEMIGELWTTGDALLAILIACFSVIFPAGKILVAQRAARRRRQRSGRP
jgi:paraquat-inducible protein A